MGSTSFSAGLSRSIAAMARSTVCPMVDCLALGLQVWPAGLLRHPEDVLRDVFVAVLRSLFSPLGQHHRVALLEGVGDVLQEDEAEHDMLVLGGVHRAAERVGHRPQLGLVAGRGTAVGSAWRASPLARFGLGSLRAMPEPSPRYDM